MASTQHSTIDESTPLLSQHNNPSSQPQQNQSFCAWLCAKNLHLGYFFITLFVPAIIAIYAFIDGLDNAYIISGIFGIGTCLYSLNHFRLLFRLKGAVDKYTKNNETLKNERIQINTDVKDLSAAKTQLKSTANSIHQSNLKLNNLIRQMDEMEDRLQSIGAHTSGNLEGIGDKANIMRGKYYNLAINQQKTLLWKLFNRLERRGPNKRGITEDDYHEFYKLVPKEYQNRFDRLGGFKAWLRVGGNDKDYVDYRDFEKGLEIYARMHVENCDIVFKIEKKKSVKKSKKRGKTGKGIKGEKEKEPEYERQVTIVSKMRRKSWYLTKDAVWNIDDDDESVASPLTEEPGLLQRRRGIKHTL